MSFLGVPLKHNNIVQKLNLKKINKFIDIKKEENRKSFETISHIDMSFEVTVTI